MASLRRARKISHIALATCTLGMLVRLARAQVRWEAPPEVCPSEAFIRERIHDALIGGDAHGIAATAIVSRGDAGYELGVEIRVDGKVNHKHIHASSCGTAAEAYVLLLTLLIRDEQPSGIPEARLNRAEAPETPPTPTQPPPARAPRSSALFVGGGPRTMFGVLPAPTLGAGLEGGIQLGAYLRIAAEGYAYLTRQVIIAPDGAGGIIGLYAAAASACVPVLGQAHSIAACAGLDFGVLSGRGVGSSIRAGSGASLWAAVRPGVEASARLGSLFSLVVRVDAPVPLVRPQFLLENRDTSLVFRPTAVGVEGSLRARLHF